MIPINDRMHTHKSGPPLICLIEMGQGLALRIRPRNSHKDRLHCIMFLQIQPKRILLRQGIARQVQPVRSNGLVDEGIDLGEGLWRGDVHGLQGRRERCLQPCEGAQEQIEQNQAVLAAVVRERDLVDAARWRWASATERETRKGANTCNGPRRSR
jgi:hypothetical protein